MTTQNVELNEVGDHEFYVILPQASVFFAKCAKMLSILLKFRKIARSNLFAAISNKQIQFIRFDP